MINKDLYPWHIDLWHKLIQQKERLPHALLLHGRAGSGKLAFATFLAKSLLCAQPVQGAACHTCPKCTWFNEGHHPDFKLISPEDAEASEDAPKKKVSKKTQIAVDQIRQLIQQLSLSNHGAQSLRVVLIHPAEAMNLASANALLKVLEEPPNNTLFLLVCHQVQRLLPTIMSRCQAIAMPMPDSQVAAEWLRQQQVSEAEVLLQYAGGAPLLALQASHEHGVNTQLFTLLSAGADLDASTSAAHFLEPGMEQAITGLQKWVYDLLACKCSLPQHYHAQYGRALQALAKGVNLKLLLDYQRQLSLAKQTANHPLSQELQMESLLLQYKKLFKP
ncbi:MAG TPA: DNA polymerase III subunit delta' [Methylophilus sp.]